jgi:hypothetical protein
MRLPARWLRLGVRLLSGAALLLVLPSARAAEPLERHLQALRTGLDPRVLTTLEAIDGSGRRMLAARSYLRSAAHLEERWSWSAAQAAEFERSAGRVALDTAVARVRCEFEAANPGYTLYVNPGFRTLELQVERWNRNETVARSAERLMADARAAVAAIGFGEPGSARGRAAFRRFLVEYAPTPTPTLAAPGLSRHGRGLAIDFQVRSGGRVVAGASVGSIASAWDEPGWSGKLQAAVAAAAAGFTGPLRDPYEPWHFDYQPAGADEATLLAPCGR